MLGESVVLGLFAATVKNGNMRFLRYMNVRYLYLPIAAFLLEFACGIIVSRNLMGLRLFMNEYYLVIQIMVYTMLVIFCYFNLRKRVFALIILGIMLNFAVIASNDGMMPVDTSTALSEGYALGVEQLENGLIAGHTLLDDETTNLAMLGDVINISSPYPFPKTISIGDIVISAGVFLFIYSTKKEENRCLLKV
ncbi:MAG: DUF5317 domain-containing protein [Peptostreptococcaceae bacterium]|nr:DUF5317 domain-containing protein [Peptostreptococcaceae bacterium]